MSTNVSTIHSSVLPIWGQVKNLSDQDKLQLFVLISQSLGISPNTKPDSSGNIVEEAVKECLSDKEKERLFFSMGDAWVDDPNADELEEDILSFRKHSTIREYDFDW